MTILCPTDFSAHSRLALDYAITLANSLDAGLHILHTFQVSTKASSMIDLRDKIRQNSEEDMQDLIKQISPSITTEQPPIAKVIEGHVVNVIDAYAGKNDIDLIIMGTQGSNSLRTKLFGSTTKKLSQKTKVPVLAVPDEVVDKTLSHTMLLAIDGKGLSNTDIFDLPRQIAAMRGVSIDVLHVRGSESSFDEKTAATYLGDVLGDVIIKEGDDPVHQIKVYTEQQDIGLIIMVRREKSFFERLFVQGNTEQEIAKTFTPLLILSE